jgi:cardiolipin synthase
LTAYLPYITVVLEILYFIAIGLVAVKIIMDTKTTAKTLAYLMLIIFLPIIGVLIYFIFGVNYRKNKFYTFKIQHNENVFQSMQEYISQVNQQVIQSHGDKLFQYETLINFLFNAIHSPVMGGNEVEVLQNGENKLKKVVEVLGRAKHHIHVEYYIFDMDETGFAIADILIRKAKEGVKVRFLYDALGSSGIRKDFIRRMEAAGVEISPVNRIRFRLLANRINYRDHRKIIIVDGYEAFTGGINISDRYINNGKHKTYWRDTHLYLRGEGIFYLQYMFLSNWMFSRHEQVPLDREYFYSGPATGEKIIQTVGSGPDTRPAIMQSTVSSIYAARKRLYIATPYFIPGESVLNAIKQAALAGLDVRLMVPAKSDSIFVNAAAFSYYYELLRAGVRVYLYQNGFLHAKTVVIDNNLSMVGSANMDIRSHEVNFEVNVLVYDRDINEQLYQAFISDLEDCEEIDREKWGDRNKWKVFFEHLARLLSPLL